MADKLYPDLIYTKVDEAPELASASLLPIVNRFVRAAGLTAVSYTHLPLPTILLV